MTALCSFAEDNLRGQVVWKNLLDSVGFEVGGCDLQKVQVDVTMHLLVKWSGHGGVLLFRQKCLFARALLGAEFMVAKEVFKRAKFVSYKRFRITFVVNHTIYKIGNCFFKTIRHMHSHSRFLHCTSRQVKHNMTDCSNPMIQI